MRIAKTLLSELDEEMATTRRLLERVPTDKGPWKPHEKSFPLGHLAQLVATMPGWLTMTLRSDHLDLAAAGSEYSFQPTEALLEQFDRHVAEARDAIGASKDEDYQLPWSLKMGEQVSSRCRALP